MTQCERLYALLSDLAWHDYHQIAAVTAERYSARIDDLKNQGYVIEQRSLSNQQGKEYRLTSLTRGPKPDKQVKMYLDKADVEALLQGVVTEQTKLVAAKSLQTFNKNQPPPTLFN